MENQYQQPPQVKQSPRWGRILLWVLASTLLLFTAIFTTLSIFSTRVWVIDKNQNHAASITNPELAYDSAYNALQQELAWFRAKLALSRNDSIAFVINLKEQQAYLKIRGVTVHTAPISSIKVDRGLRALKQGTINEMLSSPLRIRSCLATFEKEPIVTVHAPKDTLADPIPQLVMDTAVVKPLGFALELDHNIRLVVVQQNSAKSPNGIEQTRFLKRIARKEAWDNILSIASFQLPKYIPQITMELPQSDVRIIYRAVPRNGRIAIKL